VCVCVFFCEDTNSILFLKTMNVLILNMYRLFFVYDLLLSKEMVIRSRQDQQLGMSSFYSI